MLLSNAGFVTTDPEGLSAGAIVSIVVAVIVALVFIIPFTLVQVRKYFCGVTGRRRPGHTTNAELELHPEAIPGRVLQVRTCGSCG